MKQVKAMMTLGLILSFGDQIFAQEVLPEITVMAVRYKYLSAVGQKDLAQPVKMLERKAATYNIKNTDYYEDEYDTYFVSFIIPEGEILAAYDKDGKLLHTAEKYKNVALPEVVRNAVTKRFPKWGIPNDTYLVNYFQEGGTTKIYKLTLENGDQRLKVKVNEKGEFL
ncbi:MAG TPA: nicotinate-nucleotide adenylyltransferase [Flavisolibacter sp.]|jgi:hypothetical protein|nr:nicotinate-nucleotide adenylyltransferase [Flavisolibacter sp.]